MDAPTSNTDTTPWWIVIEREHSESLAVGPYADEAEATYAMENALLIEGLVQEDCIDCFTSTSPGAREAVLIDRADPHHMGEEPTASTIHLGIVQTEADPQGRSPYLEDALDLAGATDDGFVADGDSFNAWGEQRDDGEPHHVTWTTGDEVTDDLIDKVRERLARHLREGCRLADYVVVTDGTDWSEEPRIAARWALNHRLWPLHKP